MGVSFAIIRERSANLFLSIGFLSNFCIDRNQISHEISDNERLRIRSEMETRFERVLARRDSGKSISSTMLHYDRVRETERERERERKREREREAGSGEGEGKHTVRNYDPSNGIRGLRSSGVSVGIMRRQQEIRKRRRGNT